MTTLTEAEQVTLDGFIVDYLENYANKEMNPERFRERLMMRVVHFAKRGFKITDAGYGGDTPKFAIYFFNEATGYTALAQRDGEQFGKWTYRGCHITETHWLTANTPHELFAQMRAATAEKLNAEVIAKAAQLVAAIQRTPACIAVDGLACNLSELIAAYAASTELKVED